MGIGHISEHSRHTRRHQHKLQHIQQKRHPAGQHAYDALRKRDCIRGHAQAQRQQERPQCDGSPIKHDALGERPGLAHPPDVVERAVYGEHQCQRGTQQRRKPHHAQLAGLARKLVQVTQYLAGDVVGHQAFNQPLLQHVLELGKHGKGREDSQRYGDEGHQRNGGGKGQAAGGETQTVFTEAFT